MRANTTTRTGEPAATTAETIEYHVLDLFEGAPARTWDALADAGMDVEVETFGTRFCLGRGGRR